jgi:uncharacterized HAD superfamily protein
MKKNKIAIDLDSVIADLMEQVVPFHNERYHTSLTLEDYTDYALTSLWNCSQEEKILRIFEFYESPYMDKVQPMPGSNKALHHLSKNNDLFVVTSRPYSIENKTIEWLNTYFPDIFKSIHHTNQFLGATEKHVKKSAVCKEIQADIMIEDNVDFATDCVESGITTYLINQPWNKNQTVDSKIVRVNGWSEIVKYIDG